MEVEDGNLDAPAESDSDASVPEEELSESTSDETEETDGDSEAEAEGSDDAESEPSDSEKADQLPSDDDDDPEWQNFQKKFSHLKSDRDRRAAMGRAWWEKTRYASQVRKENEELKARLARLEKPPEPAPDEPRQPPPELARIQQRIETLVAKDQAVQEQQNKALISLSASDKEVAVIEDRLKDADEYQKAILEQRLETAKVRRESILNRWADLNEKREAISLEMEQRITDRDWTAKFLQDKANREQLERRDIESFNAEFPKHVDKLIVSAADDLGAPKDQKIRQSLWKTVNRAMMVDLLKLGEKGLDSVNVPSMVRAHVKEYLEDRDLVGRSKFVKASAEKLKVAGREAGKPPAGRPASAAMRPPVPPALLSQGDTTPAMRAARERLTKRFGG